jgi:hypothetical protein
MVLTPFFYVILWHHNKSYNVKNLLILASIILITQSCNMKRMDTSKMVNEMQNIELKRITPAQISSFANDWGTEIVDYLGKNKKNEANIDSLSKLFHASITKVDVTKTAINNLDKKEQQIIQAYQYSLQHNQPIIANLQKLSNEDIQLFTAPVSGENNTIWRIEFTKKEIIRHASVKEIKKMVVNQK